jgi:alpha-galactosidase
MGWNSWNRFHCSVTAGLLAETADQMVSLGLAKAGYEYTISAS